MRALIVSLIIFTVALFVIPIANAGSGSCGDCTCCARCVSSPSPTAKSSDCPGGVCAVEPSKTVEVKPHATSGSIITTEGLKALLSSGVPLHILDARSGKYDDGRRIPGAKSLNAESKVSTILRMLPEKEALIVTYCSNLKCPASGKLFEHLKSLGYKNLIEYPEGIQGWLSAGHEVETIRSE
ncbi:MAG TPA: rhodanese-like domain-containing protein [Candidatus Ozemobacteraceae bacterium]|nr:rhodanese-like domain-containing protein [Candidatus Ozemobacteraceae bacterium]